MSRILTVTLNPALDLATEVETVTPDVKLRCTAARADPGGGGLNVARAITQPVDYITPLGYRDRDLPYYGVNMHQEGMITMNSFQEPQEGTPEESSE